MFCPVDHTSGSALNPPASSIWQITATTKLKNPPPPKNLFCDTELNNSYIFFHLNQVTLCCMGWPLHTDTLIPNNRVSWQFIVKTHNLCVSLACDGKSSVAVVHVPWIYISSVCWHGVADTSCIREVSKQIWTPAWNSRQWGHWSWCLSIWQHRRWWLLPVLICGLCYVTLFWNVSSVIGGAPFSSAYSAQFKFTLADTKEGVFRILHGCWFVVCLSMLVLVYWC